MSLSKYEKDKDITMLVCSLGFEYKYLNISKVIEVPTRIEWILGWGGEDWWGRGGEMGEERGEGKEEKNRKEKGREEYSIIYNKI